MAAEAEQERAEYTERAELAEEAKERACEDRDQLQVSNSNRRYDGDSNGRKQQQPAVAITDQR